MKADSFWFFFFSSKGVLPKIWGHPTHTQHFCFPTDESNPRAKQIKNIHSFNCFIKPALPWIIYVAPQRYIYLHSLLSFTHSLASGMLSPLSLKQPFTPSIHLLLGLPLLQFPSTSASFIFFTNLSPSIFSTCPNHRKTRSTRLFLELNYSAMFQFRLG